MSRVEAALALAERGFFVFPLKPNTKRPLASGWQEAATTDPAAIRLLWEEEPNANIGVFAGKSGLLIIDLDVKTHDGVSAFAALAKEHKITLDTYRVQTPSGGVHVYYRLPPNVAVSSTAGKTAPGVDTRSDGGYVVGPGSELDGVPYEESPDYCFHDPAPAPAALIALAGTAEAKHSEADRWLVTPDLPENVERAVDFLKGTEPAIEGHGGNNWTYATAEVVRGLGVSQDRCKDLMLEHFNPRCSPPWELCDLGQVVLNAYQYAKRPGGHDAVDRKASIKRLAEAAGVNPIQGDPRGSLSRFRVLRGPEVRAIQKPRWLVANTIPETALSLVYGPSGYYKSFIALDLALSIACGVPWAGHETLKHPVLYISGEGSWGIRTRYMAWCKNREIEEVPQFHLLPQMPLFAETSDLREAAAAVRAAGVKGLGLIVVDTVARAMAGLDENAQKDAALFVARCDELREAFRTAVLGIHHVGKDETKGARGSTVLPAACDTVFRVEEGGVPRTVILKMTKQKDAEEWQQSQGFTLERVELGGDESSLVPRPSTVRARVAGIVEERRRETMEAVLLDAPVLPLPSAALADEIAARLEGENSRSVRDWLRRIAAKRFGSFVASQDPLEFTHPSRMTAPG